MKLWYIHPESNCVVASEPTDGDGCLVELGPCVTGRRAEILSLLRNNKIDPRQFTGIPSQAYAGIGSRQTPDWVLERMETVAEFLAASGWTLRSGGAEGADTAFERGCIKGAGKREIFLPWAGFNDSRSFLHTIPAEAFKLAERYHPSWLSLKQGAQKLMARNCQQVLGSHLNDPVEFIICYTAGGRGSGGTGQALRIADDRNIPVLDMGQFCSLNVLDNAICNFLQHYAVAS
jgi:hypothetical protein